MTFIFERNKKHRCFGTKLEKGEDFFLESTTILGDEV